jgi:hypothetical protein
VPVKIAMVGLLILGLESSNELLVERHVISDAHAVINVETQKYDTAIMVQSEKSLVH